MIFKYIKFDKLKEDHVSAYAAQSAFFLMLSLIPIMLLLLTLVQYTPVTKADVMLLAYEVLPTSIRLTIISIINEVYNQKSTTIPLTAVAAIWSAGRGTLAITNGLNCIYGQKETRGYIYLRIRSAVYTVSLLVAIVLCLVVLGFGNRISLLVSEHIPVFAYAVRFIIRIRTIASICLIVLFSAMVFKFLPNNKRDWKNQIPGAIFTALGWAVASFVFSIYIDIFKGFSNMYGSLTTIVLIMLWLYFCMYILLLGGEVNVIISQGDTKDGFWKAH